MGLEYELAVTLRNASASDRRKALKTFGDVVWPQPLCMDTLESIAALLDDEAGAVCKEAVCALCRLGAVAAAPAARRLSHEKAQVRRRAAEVLANCGGDVSPHLDELRGCLRDTCKEVHAAAATALGALAHAREDVRREAAQALAGYLENGGNIVSASDALLRLGDVAAPFITNYVQHLQQKLCSVQPDAREYAAEELGYLGSLPAVRERVVRALQDAMTSEGHWMVRASLKNSLCKLGVSRGDSDSDWDEMSDGVGSSAENDLDLEEEPAETAQSYC